MNKQKKSVDQLNNIDVENIRLKDVQPKNFTFVNFRESNVDVMLDLTAKEQSGITLIFKYQFEGKSYDIILKELISISKGVLSQIIFVDDFGEKETVITISLTFKANVFGEIMEQLEAYFERLLKQVLNHGVKND